VAINEAYIDVPPERVFAVLADASRYAEWVVGTHAIREADEDFPAPGTRFQHRLGLPPLTVDDDTEVLTSDPPRQLTLLTKARPFGVARVQLRLQPDGAGTRVTMTETPADIRARLLVNPLTDPLVRARNVQSLRRLRRLAERG
jgi:uncharacterized protein YndB with AHSA1/START domain